MNLRMVRRSAVALLMLAILSLVLLMPGTDNASAKEVEFEDFKALLESHDESTGTYGDLSAGDTAVFEDLVEISTFADGKRTIWLSSVGGGFGLPNLTLPDDEVDGERQLDIYFKPGARIRFSLKIIEDGSGSQILVPYIGGIEVIEEGKDNGPIEKDEIEVFGIRIQQTFLPEDLRTPLVRFLIVFTVWALGTVLIWIILWIGLKFARKTKTDLDVKLLNIIRGPFFIILLLYGLLVSISQLELDQRIIDLLDLIYRAGTIIVVAYISIKIFKKVIMVYLMIISKKTETQADDVLVPVMGKIVTVLIWIVAGIYFMKVFGFDITVFLGAMGIIGLVIAFAAQDTLSNFFAGIMILLDRPFKEGDWLDLDGSVYQVKDIGLRSTRLFHSFSNQVVTIPNNRISDHMFSNLNEPDSYGRNTVKVGVSYGSDPVRIGGILMEIIRSHKDTFEDEDHATFYRFNDFGDSSLDFAITFWVKDFNDKWRVASEIRERIFERFEKEGIEIPFPQNVLHWGKGSEPAKADASPRDLSA
ncbi:MAG: mechanosensitive ion channel family protein [Candidatus Thermoplasmatota archaeon]|nr:mechanosensitive ion channel family protein [Candidatus Thermoplasmatota archaeon]